MAAVPIPHFHVRSARGSVLNMQGMCFENALCVCVHVKTELSWHSPMGTEGRTAGLGCNAVRELSMT